MALVGVRWALISEDTTRPTAFPYASWLQQQETVPKQLFELSLTIGELLACTEASTIFYMQNTKEYIKMKEVHVEDSLIMREKLWQTVNAKSSMEKLQCILEGVNLSVLVEYREFERSVHPPLAS